jgi:hypothetical protein
VAELADALDLGASKPLFAIGPLVWIYGYFIDFKEKRLLYSFLYFPHIIM